MHFSRLSAVLHDFQLYYGERRKKPPLKETLPGPLVLQNEPVDDDYFSTSQEGG
jgi:hypothetical protein